MPYNAPDSSWICSFVTKNDSMHVEGDYLKYQQGLFSSLSASPQVPLCLYVSAEFQLGKNITALMYKEFLLQVYGDCKILGIKVPNVDVFRSAIHEIADLFGTSKLGIKNIIFHDHGSEDESVLFDIHDIKHEKLHFIQDFCASDLGIIMQSCLVGKKMAPMLADALGCTLTAPNHIIRPPKREDDKVTGLAIENDILCFDPKGYKLYVDTFEGDRVASLGPCDTEYEETVLIPGSLTQQDTVKYHLLEEASAEDKFFKQYTRST